MPAPRLFRFDNTIHAGHVLTAVTIAACTAGAWFSMEADIRYLKDYKDRQQQEIAELRNQVARQGEDARAQIADLRKEMLDWFRRLDDKLEKKR